MPEAKDAAGVKIFPPALPLLTVLLGIGLDRRFPFQSELFDPGAGKNIVGWLIIIVSVLGLGFWSVSIMRKSGQSENPYKPTTMILKDGPFRITRNPMYLQMVLICIGLGIVLWNFWILLLTPVCIFLLTYWVILPEEKYLAAKFGEAYETYKKSVRRWI